MSENKEELEICLYFDGDQTGVQKDNIFTYDLPEKKKMNIMEYISQLQRSEKMRENKLNEYSFKLESALDVISKSIEEYSIEHDYQYRHIQTKADELIAKVILPNNESDIQGIINRLGYLEVYFKDYVVQTVSAGVGVIMEDARKACNIAKLKGSRVEISEILRELHHGLKNPNYIVERAILKP